MKARLHPHWAGGRAGYVYSVIYDGELIVSRSRDPECDAARALLAKGLTGKLTLLDGTDRHPAHDRTLFAAPFFMSTRPSFTEPIDERPALAGFLLPEGLPMNDDLEPAPFDPPPDNAQLDIEQVIAERPPLDAILAQARQAPEINTEQLEVSADQLDAIRSQQ